MCEKVFKNFTELIDYSTIQRLATLNANNEKFYDNRDFKLQFNSKIIAYIDTDNNDHCEELNRIIDDILHIYGLFISKINNNKNNTRTRKNFNKNLMEEFVLQIEKRNFFDATTIFSLQKRVESDIFEFKSKTIENNFKAIHNLLSRELTIKSLATDIYNILMNHYKINQLFENMQIRDLTKILTHEIILRNEKSLEYSGIGISNTFYEYEQQLHMLKHKKIYLKLKELYCEGYEGVWLWAKLNKLMLKKLE